MRKVYTVKGSQDGIIGVYSSKIKATDRAIAYVRGSWAPTIDWETSTPSRIESKDSYDIYADIEFFYLNAK